MVDRPFSQRLVADQDIGLFDVLAEEEVSLFGVSVEWWCVEKVNYDPLYQELVEERFDGPHRMLANVEWYREETAPEASENGMKVQTESDIRIPRVVFEGAMGKGREPRIGDVVKLFVQEVNGDIWFDVVSANRGSAVYGTSSFVWFICKGRARSESPPNERTERTL